jgi:alanine racemase
MNRFGVSSEIGVKMLSEKLLENGVELKSVYTHFSNTENKRRTYESYQRFLALLSNLSQNVPICLGGSGVIDYSFQYDMLRLGIGLYGYGREGLQPVMRIESFVCKTFFAKSGEYVGYGKFFKVENDGKFAIIPVGYGDGLSRRLSGKISVLIHGRKFPLVGRICMDV